MTAKSIFSAHPVDDVEWVLPADDRDFDRFADFGRGRSLAAGWRTVEMRMVTQDQGRQLSAAETPWFASNAIVLKPRARKAVGSALEPWGELLPISCSGTTFHVFHALRVIDAIDTDRSNIVRFSSGEVLDIERLVLVGHAIEGVEVFQLPNVPSKTFFSQRIVDLFAAHHLSGIAFTCEWPNDDGLPR